MVVFSYIPRLRHCTTVVATIIVHDKLSIALCWKSPLHCKVIDDVA